MRFGFNLKTCRNQVLTSWKSSDDPATGDFSSWLDLQGTPQFFLYKNSAPNWCDGPWNCRTLSGVPDVATRLKTYKVDYSNEIDLFAYSFNNDSGGTYITFLAKNGTIPFMLTLDHLGSFQSLIWSDQDSNGTKSWERQRDAVHMSSRVHANVSSGLVHKMCRKEEGIGAPEIVDSCLAQSCLAREALRCIQVGLLCIQDSTTYRPSMSNVVFMLSNETTLPYPKQPSFAMRRVQLLETDDLTSTGARSSSSVNGVTFAAPNAR
ncbi:hypothetical protein LWI28_001186 [Acer negundo]|uniref:Uncharacterized protein n=1 Tax=Acer negundo TaxID=4023 RepID=A0AAD5JRT6_ACENE|nr:hypothetical protein LWI28_001186 [Acer negundo]